VFKIHIGHDPLSSYVEGKSTNDNKWHRLDGVISITAETNARTGNPSTVILEVYADIDIEGVQPHFISGSLFSRPDHPGNIPALRSDEV
jgi:hypothetical protein